MFPSESERRVLASGGQAGCSLCERARRDLTRRGYLLPPAWPRRYEESAEDADSFDARNGLRGAESAPEDSPW